MDELNTRNLQIIQRVTNEARTEVKFTSLWSWFHMEYGIGQKNVNQLKLTVKDHDNLRAIVKNLTGIDLLNPLPSGSRLEVAKSISNEKLFSENPNRHYVLLNSPNGLLTLNGFEIPLLLGSSYRCDWRTLQSEFNSVEKIIVVENLQAFDHIQMAQLPIELKSAWIIYRGHNESNRAVIDLLNKLPKTCEIIGFTDYDPAGISILLTSISKIKITSCLLPELSEDLFKQGIGTEPIFQKQQQIIDRFSQRELPKIINDYWQALLKHRVCLSQELLLSQNRLLHQISLFK